MCHFTRCFFHFPKHLPITFCQSLLIFHLLLILLAANVKEQHAEKADPGSDGSGKWGASVLWSRVACLPPLVTGNRLICWKATEPAKGLGRTVSLRKPCLIRLRALLVMDMDLWVWPHKNNLIILKCQKKTLEKFESIISTSETNQIIWNSKFQDTL